MIRSLSHYGFLRHIYLGRRNLHRAVCTGKRNLTWLSAQRIFHWMRRNNQVFLAFLQMSCNICYMVADICCSRHLEFKYKSLHKEGNAILLLEETLTVCWINYLFGNHSGMIVLPRIYWHIVFLAYHLEKKKKKNIYWFQHSFWCKDEWSNYVWLYLSPEK